jgi:hypothetical protein
MDLMRPWHRLRRRTAITVERRSYASEGEQRAVTVNANSGFSSGRTLLNWIEELGWSEPRW